MLSALPTILQFCLMHQTPLFSYKGHFTRQATFAILASGDLHQRLKALLFSVDVGRWLIAVPHANDDTQENGERRHTKVFFYEVSTEWYLRSGVFMRESSQAEILWPQKAGAEGRLGNKLHAHFLALGAQHLLVAFQCQKALLSRQIQKLRRLQTQLLPHL